MGLITEFFNRTIGKFGVFFSWRDIGTDKRLERGNIEISYENFKGVKG